MDSFDSSRKHFMFVLAIVAIFAVGAFSWIAIDSANVENTLVEGSMYSVVSKRQATSAALIIKSLDRLNIEGDSLEELDLVLNQF